MYGFKDQTGKTLIDTSEAIQYVGEVFDASETVEHFELAEKYCHTVMLFMKDHQVSEFIDGISGMTEKTKLRISGDINE